MGFIRRVFDFKGTPILAVGFLLLLVAETKRPLRQRTKPRWPRAFINSVVAIPSFALLRLVFLPFLVKLAQKNQHLKWGLNYQYQAPPLVKGIVVFLLLDYTNYLWHVLNHKVPLLWRFHVVHHSDKDLDLTTAIRFHFGEIIGSIFYRGFFVFVSGATPHGIHHSVVPEETNSNYSVIFSFWDRLHQTLRLSKPQHEVVIGLPEFNQPELLTVARLLKLPFTYHQKR
jgi:sterol desaturase/sphingolipid hydroxylase (fatty acid hydroxylase superfamily)